MPDQSGLIPDDPLDFVRRSIVEGKILWTYHVQMRLRGRSISRDTSLESVESFEIIESYPEDKYLPSYLVYARHRQDIFHVLFVVDVPGDNVRVVTAYWPNARDWEPGFRTRRRNP